MSWRKGWNAPGWLEETDEFIILFFQIVLMQNSWPGKEFNQFSPQTAVTTFAFSYVFILLLFENYWRNKILREIITFLFSYFKLRILQPIGLEWSWSLSWAGVFSPQRNGIQLVCPLISFRSETEAKRSETFLKRNSKTDTLVSLVSLRSETGI